MYAYLPGMFDSGLDEVDPCNPACITDCLGNNVGDIACMSADLHGSFALATCAALVVAGVSKIKDGWSSMLSPFAFVCWGVLSRASSRFSFTLRFSLWPRMQLW